MKRRKFVGQAAGVGFAGFIAPILWSCNGDTEKMKKKVEAEVLKARYDFNQVGAYTITPVNSYIWTFEERGGTILFAIKDEGIAIIDTQFPDQSKHLVEAIREKTETPIEVLINTHHHADHTSGNIAFKDMAKVHVAHENSLKNQRRSAEERGTMDQQLFPSVTFDKEWKTNFGGEELRMRYYGAAHTDGDAVTTFLDANVVHMGDLVFNRRFPYIDMSAGANIEHWITVLDGVLGDHNAETKYIFGHSDNGFGIHGTDEDLKAFKNYLERLMEFGLASSKAGKSLDELLASTEVIPGAEEWKGKGIERSLKAVYSELGM